MKLKAYNKVYQKYYDSIEKDGLSKIVKKTIEKFDFDGYRKFRRINGFYTNEDYDYKLVITDYIMELFDCRDRYCYSAHLCCKLTKNKCEISYGKTIHNFSTKNYEGPLRYQFSTSITELRKEKIKRLLND